MKKLRVVYDGPLFPGSGGGPRHFEGLAEGIQLCGADLQVVLPRDSAVNHVKIGARCRTIAAPGNRAVRHLTYEISRVALMLYWIVRGRRFDVWVSRHSLFGGSLALARILASVVALEVNGPVREEIELNFRSRPLAVLADFMFRLQIRAADIVFPVSPGLADYVTHRVPHARCHILPNGASRNNPPSSDVESRVGVPARMVYSGTLAPWYDLETVIKSIAHLRDAGRDDVAFTIVGHGSEYDRLREVCWRAGLEDVVSFTGWVSGDRARCHVMSADVGIIPMSSAASGRSPLKLYEYAAAELSIVAVGGDGVSNSPLSAEIFTYEAGDVLGCAESVLAALKVGRRKYDEALWSWSHRAEELLSVVGDMGTE